MIGGAKGIGIGIDFGLPNLYRKPSGKSYIDPDVLASLRVVTMAYGKTNNDSDRAVVKNLVDASNPFIISNAAYKLNSGYGKYGMDFLEWKSNSGMSFTSTKLTSTKPNLSGGWLTFRNVSGLIPETKVKVSGAQREFVFIANNNGTDDKFSVTINNGVYTIPEFTLSSTSGFYINNNSGDWSNLVIEQIPSYQGAFVTDGVDDLITSTKTVQEMGITDEITVVSMIGQLSTPNVNNYTNTIRNQLGATGSYNKIAVSAIDKTGIYGYSFDSSLKCSIINDILGDKQDYSVSATTQVENISAKYLVQGWIDINGLARELSSVAWYWTIIANKVLTTDQINQVIAYYNLDRCVEPTVWYDVQKQGLTNDTPDSDWYLKDFSGNGHDMQLYNYAKSKNSGIGKYELDFNEFATNTNINTVLIEKNKDTFYAETLVNSSTFLIYKTIRANNTLTDTPSFKAKVEINKGTTLQYRYINSDGVQSFFNITEEGEHEFPISYNNRYVNSAGVATNGFVLDGKNTCRITQIPDYEGALVSDGKDDYGQFVGDLGLKDYTIAVDRAYVEGLGSQVPIISSIGTTVNTPFLMEHMGIEKILAPYSFGTYTALSTLNTDRFISYQSTYKYNGDNLTKGTSTDTGSGLTIGRFGAKNFQYAKLALWSFLLFPYSLSEFLLERQLKKYKLGTLYPDMVEFRPVISGNIPYNAIEISQGSTTLYNKSINKTGIYLQEGSTVRVYIQPSGIDEVSKITVNGVEYTDLPINPNGYYYADFPITKSPQKIDITIDEYIRFEDIVQPYPEIWTITQNGNKVSWGDKLKVGSEFGYNSKVNLLSDVYTTTNSYYNGKVVKEGNILKVEKQMTFACDKTWKLNTTEPHAIYSPQKLNIPNSSLKILGYVPDLTGKGNHGKLNNFAYTEDSGVAADGSIKFDGTDDHITIPTLAHGDKCVMMKVNWNKDGLMLYDQRKDDNHNAFAIYIPIFNNEDSIAYSSRNDGETYIDGVLNTYVKGSQLKDVTHNITITNSNSNNDNTVSPAIGSNAKYNAYYANMSLYEFMLFPEIPSEDEIKKLNDVMGIEGGYVESPEYYWDAYGKKNTDTDRNLIADQVSKDIANALEVKNVAYNSESGYTDDNGLLLDGVEDHAINTVIPAVTDFTVIAKRKWLGDYQPSAAFVTKGTSNTYTKAAFMMEYKAIDSIQIGSFGVLNSGQNMPDLITYMTPTDYNKAGISKGTAIDENGLIMGKYNNTHYLKGVFYKMMLYTKTIDYLSINMLKNMFERDELIDVTNPIFKKKEL